MEKNVKEREIKREWRKNVDREDGKGKMYRKVRADRTRDEVKREKDGENFEKNEKCVRKVNRGEKRRE